MKRLLIPISLLSLLLPGPASGQWYDVDTGDQVPDAGWRRSNEGFGAALVVTKEFDGSRREWISSDGSTLADIRTGRTIRRGDVVMVPVFYTSTDGVAGEVRPVVGYRILRPDGAVFSEMPPTPVDLIEPVEPGRIHVCNLVLKFFVEPEEPLGTYTVQATCGQNPSSTPLAMTQRIEVVE